MKVYISSTFDDLVEYRAAAADVLRKLGHDVRGMEAYVAESVRPVEVCEHDAQVADIVVLILGWRYGHIPEGSDQSITEREYRAAVVAKVPVVPFLVPLDAPWPASRMDAITRENKREKIEALRAEVSREHIVATFSTPDGLSSEVAAAMRRAEATKQLSRRALRAADRAVFTEMRSGGPLTDTAGFMIVEAIRKNADAEVVTVDIGDGNVWWSTRLYLLAALAADLTSIRQFLFTRPQPGSETTSNRSGQIVIGLATPQAVRQRLIEVFPVLAEFESRALESERGLLDTVAGSQRRLVEWDEFFAPRPRARPNGEDGEKMWVREGLLNDWLGDNLIRGAVTVDPLIGLTVAQVQQILQWPWPYVPVLGIPSDDDASDDPEAGPSRPRDESVPIAVNRDAFAREFAKEWVARELPRNVAR